MTQPQRKISTPSLCAFIGGIQVSETSWFIVTLSSPSYTSGNLSLPQTPVPHMRLHRKDGNNYQRQRRCSAKGTVRLYCSWCNLRYHVPALSKASCTLAKPVEGFRIVSGNTFVQWRASNRTPATREVVSPWPNTSIYLTTTKSRTCECLW